MYSNEYTSGCSGPAASHLATPPSPRHERQRRIGSLQDAKTIRQHKKIVVWFVWSVWFFWLNETNQMDQINQMNQTDRTRLRRADP